MKPIRVGVVGVRFGATAHLPAFAAQPACTVTAIAGRDADAVARATAGRDVPHRFTDWRELVRSRDVDVVTVAVPPALQPEIVVEAARHGKHVFCEKPLGASVDAVRSAVDATDAAGVVHAIDFLFPEVRAWEQARALIRSHAIGRPVHFSYRWHVETFASRTNTPSWKSDTDAGGGALGNFVSHVLYNIGWLLGPISTLGRFELGQGSRSGRAVDGSVEVDPGIQGRLSVSTDAFLGCGHVIEVFGEHGTLVLANSGPDYVTGFTVAIGARDTATLRRVDVPAEATGRDGRVDALARLAGRFVAAVRTNGAMSPNLHDGLLVQRQLATIAGTMPRVQVAG